MKIILTGSNGQLGKAIALKKPLGIDLIPLDRKEFDITNYDECKKIIFKFNPDWILNAGAYTLVDKAETNKDIALKVNRDGPKMLSEILYQKKGRLLHISTDYIFDGKKSEPYKVDDKVNPLSVYGLSKALGEKEIEKVFGDSNKAIILRTSWLMGPIGRNFASTMLKLHSEKEIIKVVADQYGCSTSVFSLANFCWQVILQANSKENSIPRILHWRDEGITTWFEVAKAIGEMGINLKINSKKANVIPISTEEYKSPARRPKFSILDTSETKHIFKLEPLNWEKSLINDFNQNFNF